MEVSAKLRNLRVAPRKVRFVVDGIRGRDINDALNRLQHSPRKKTAEAVSKLLKSAVSNAVSDERKASQLDVDKLFVKTVMVGEGPTLKRYMPRAKGAASPLKKRTSHIYLTLAER